MSTDITFKHAVNTVQIFHYILGSRQPSYSYKEHYHPLFELLECREGEIALEVDGRPPIVLSTGDRLLVKSGFKHQPRNRSDKEPYLFFHVHFDIDDPELRQLLGSVPYLHLSVEAFSPYLLEIQSQLDESMREAAEGLYNASVSGELLPPMTSRLLLQAYVLLLIGEMAKTLLRIQAQSRQSAVKDSTLTEIDLAHQLESKLKSLVCQPVSIAGLARELNMSRSQCTKVFTKVYGVSPHHYINRLKQNKAKELLVNTDMPIGEIAQYLAFGSVQHFSRQFRRWTGMSPSRFRPKQLTD